MPTVYDCIVIGGGIGGLTAGIYLSRFQLKTCIIDSQQSRASLISTSHNFPGFPEGIGGKDLLSRLTKQYQIYTQDLVYDTAVSITKESDIFTVKTVNSSFSTKNIILATGVIDIEPSLPKLKEAIKNGLIRHCLICDGFEVINKKVGVICNSKNGLRLAFLLKAYTQEITLINIGKKFSISEKERKKLKMTSIKFINDAITEVVVTNNVICGIKTASDYMEFDSIYSSLGIYPRTEIAKNLKVKCNKENLILVNAKQETNIKGVFAIGDIVPGLNQMVGAASQAAIAAVTLFTNMKKL
jgi:thioredoxin reductase (NADPH)